MISKKSCSVTALLVTFVVTACSSGPTFLQFGQAGSAPPGKEAARAFIGPCLGAPTDGIRAIPQDSFFAAALLAPVAGAAASAVVQTALGTVASALEEAGKDRTTSIIATGSTGSLSTVYGMVHDLGEQERVCLQVVIAEFANQDVPSSIATGLGSVKERLRALRIPVLGEPRFVVEYTFDLPNKIRAAGGSIDSSRPTTAFRLIETWRLINGSLDGSSAFGSQRELVVSIMIVPVGDDLSKSPPLLVPVEHVAAGARYFTPTRRTAPSTLWSPMSDEMMSKPLNVIAVMSETQNGNSFAAAVAKALKSETLSAAAGAAASSIAQDAVSSDARINAKIESSKAEKLKADEVFALFDTTRQTIADARACMVQCEALVQKAKFYASYSSERARILKLTPPQFDLSGL